jgi:hypothetical protein
MDGYAVCTRIERASPYFAGAGRGPGPSSGSPGWTVAYDGAASAVFAQQERLELIGEPLDERIARATARVREAFAGVRDLWSETTFYLFDADGWR